MTVLDFKTDQKDLYSPGTDFSVVEVPVMTFFALDGAGDPNTSPNYTAAVEALFAASYATKFSSKRELERDYVVGPLEGLWWSENPAKFAQLDKKDWLWTVMIRQPEWLTNNQLLEILHATAEKKKSKVIAAIRPMLFNEGLCVQAMHIGPYDDEPAKIAALHADYLPANNFVETGKHHEIYLSDPRTVKPEKLRTILRQPVQRKY